MFNTVVVDKNDYSDKVKPTVNDKQTYKPLTNLEQTLVVNLFPHLRNDNSTGNSNTWFISQIY